MFTKMLDHVELRVLHSVPVCGYYGGFLVIPTYIWHHNNETRSMRVGIHTHKPPQCISHSDIYGIAVSTWKQASDERGEARKSCQHRPCHRRDSNRVLLESCRYADSHRT